MDTITTISEPPFEGFSLKGDFPSNEPEPPIESYLDKAPEYVESSSDPNALLSLMAGEPIGVQEIVSPEDLDKSLEMGINELCVPINRWYGGRCNASGFTKWLEAKIPYRGHTFLFIERASICRKELRAAVQEFLFKNGKSSGYVVTKNVSSPVVLESGVEGWLVKTSVTYSVNGKFLFSFPVEYTLSGVKFKRTGRIIHRIKRDLVLNLCEVLQDAISVREGVSKKKRWYDAIMKAINEEFLKDKRGPILSSYEDFLKKIEFRSRHTPILSRSEDIDIPDIGEKLSIEVQGRNLNCKIEFFYREFYLCCWGEYKYRWNKKLSRKVLGPSTMFQVTVRSDAGPHAKELSKSSVNVERVARRLFKNNPYFSSAVNLLQESLKA